MWVKLSNSLFFETGLYGSQKGFKRHIKEEFDGYNFEVTFSQNLIYLEVPILAKMYLPINKGRFYGSAGPSIGIGVHGKNKFKIYENGVLEEEDEEEVKWGNTKEEELKRLDIGGQIGIGYEINKFQVGIQYNIGFTNILSKEFQEDFDASLKNRAFTLYVGYRF
jgi:hypothetical protein